MEALENRSVMHADSSGTSTVSKSVFSWSDEVELPANAHHHPKIFAKAIEFLNNVKARFGANSDQDTECHAILMKWRDQKLSNEQLHWQMVKLFQDHNDLREAFESFYHATLKKAQSTSPALPPNPVAATSDSPTVIHPPPVPMQVPFSPKFRSLWPTAVPTSTSKALAYNQLRDVAITTSNALNCNSVPSIYQSSSASIHPQALPLAPFLPHTHPNQSLPMDMKAPAMSPFQIEACPQQQTGSYHQDELHSRETKAFTVIVMNFDPAATIAYIQWLMGPVGADILAYRFVRSDPLIVELDFAEKSLAQTVVATFNNKQIGGRVLSVCMKNVPSQAPSTINPFKSASSTPFSVPKRPRLASDVSLANTDITDKAPGSISTGALSRYKARGTGPFVHAICGQHFSSRASVRKHHFGNIKHGQQESSGCWYKRGKPDTAWDAHPSCRTHVEPSKNPISPLAPRSSRMTNLPVSKIATGAATKSRPSVITSLPDLPTLTDLPAKVASIVSRGSSLSGTPIPLPENVRDLQQQPMSVPLSLGPSSQNLYALASLASDLSTVYDQRAPVVENLEKRAEYFNLPDSDEMDLVGDRPSSRFTADTSGMLSREIYGKSISLPAVLSNNGGKDESLGEADTIAVLPKPQHPMPMTSKTTMPDIFKASDTILDEHQSGSSFSLAPTIKKTKPNQRKRGRNDIEKRELESLGSEPDKPMMHGEEPELSSEQLRKLGLGLRAGR